MDNVKEIVIDPRRVLVVPGDAQATVAYAASHWLACCQEAVKNHGTFFVALSGGSTPKAIFEQLTKPPYQNQIPWDKIHLFWSDERSVPPSDPESNYHMAMESGLKDMPIPSSQIYRMQGEGDIQEHAAAYEETTRNVLKDQPFDLVMLGMGDDGHTASLFPRTKGLIVEDKWVIANHVPQKETWRMSLTYSCINKALHIAIYVIGSSKSDMVAKVLKGPDQPFDLPSQKIGTAINQALWICDTAAAAKL